MQLPTMSTLMGPRLNSGMGEVAVAAASIVGDSSPRSARVIEVHVVDMQQLFNSMDPSPFHDRDLDPDAEEFIVTSARELPRNARLALIIHLDAKAVISAWPISATDILRLRMG